MSENKSKIKDVLTVALPSYQIAAKHLDVSDNDIASLTCSICLQIFKDPVMLYNPIKCVVNHEDPDCQDCKDPCLHRFCRSCLETLLHSSEGLNSRKTSCPLCKQEILFRRLTFSTILLKDYHFRQELAEKKTKCVMSDQCTWTGKLGMNNKELEQHLRFECDFAQSPCPACQELILCKNASSHVQQCPKLEIRCTNCGHMLARHFMPTHLKNLCLERLVICTSCFNPNIRYINMNQHLIQECPKRQVKCTFVPCPFECSAEMLHEHQKSCDHRPTVCQWCQVSVPLSNLQTHVTQECLQVVEECKCGSKISRQNLNEHKVENCPLAHISCPYVNVGCPNTTILKSELKAHLQEHLAEHLALAHNSAVVPKTVLTNGVNVINEFKKLQLPFIHPKFEGKVHFVTHGIKLPRLRFFEGDQSQCDDVPIGMFAEIEYRPNCSVPVIITEEFSDIDDYVQVMALLGGKSKHRVLKNQLICPGFQISFDQWKLCIQTMSLWNYCPVNGVYGHNPNYNPIKEIYN